MEGDAVLCNHEVAGINRDGEIRSAAHIIGCVYSGIHALFKVNTCSRYKVTAGRKPDHPNFVRVDVPFRRMLPCEADGSLSVIESLRSFRVGTR